MRAYNDYTESGIAWLGKIPGHWQVKRLKDELYLQTGNSISDKGQFEEKNIDTQFYVSTKDIDYETGEINYDNGIYVPKSNHSFKRAKENSTLICIEGANAGKKIGFTKFEICFVNKLCAIKSKNKLTNDKYFFYYSNSKFFSNQFFPLITGLIGGVSIKQIKLFNVILPPKEEQTAIAHYLDTKTQVIDQLISLLKKKLGCYKALRESIINNAVTKGLANHVPWKDSGITWMGAIPRHWEVKRVKDLFSEYPKSKIPASEGKSVGKYKFFTSSNIQSKFLDFFEMHTESILFSTGGSAGVHYCNKEYSYSTDCWAIYHKKNIFLKFYSYYFESILHEIQQQGFKGSSLEHLQKDFIKLSKIILPPKEEQKAIAQYLDSKTDTIDSLVSHTEAQIVKLQELRKTLIHDVVTGKIKVLA